MASCQMGNHYHLVLHTRQANLSRLMRQVNGVYIQTFNLRLARLGTCFKGTSKALAACNNHRAQALLMAYREGGMTMTALAKEAGISVTHVGGAAEAVAGGRCPCGAGGRGRLITGAV